MGEERKYLSIDERVNQDRFIEFYKETGSITAAARKAKVNRCSIYGLRRLDPDFDKRCTEARAMGIDAMEDEAIRRAVEGDEQPVYKDGKVIGTRVSYSDLLMIFLLKGMKPDTYKDRVENVNYNRDLDLADRLKEARQRNRENESK
jgi:hypothetical protein